MLCTTHLEHTTYVQNAHFIVVCLCNGLAQNEFIYSNKIDVFFYILVPLNDKGCQRTPNF